MTVKRKNYPPHRKYQSWQLKRILRQLECNLEDLKKQNPILVEDAFKRRLNESLDMVFEISLRLD